MCRWFQDYYSADWWDGREYNIYKSYETAISYKCLIYKVMEILCCKYKSIKSKRKRKRRRNHKSDKYKKE